MQYKLKRLGALSVAAWLLVGGGLHACSGNTPLSDASVASPGQNDNNPNTINLGSCEDTVFAGSVWNQVIAPNCFGCHVENGFAQQSGARFILNDKKDPSYIANNLAVVRSMDALKANGMPLLLAKATDQVSHGGGRVLDPNGDDAAALTTFLARTDLTQQCIPAISTAQLATLPLQDPNAGARRAALLLAGRLPNATEAQQVSAGNFSAALDSMLADPNFTSLIKRTYENTFLTDAYNNDNVIGFLYDAFYADGSWYDGSMGNLGHEVVLDWGMAHNSTELAAYIISQDRPYTEILTADYMMVNAQGACSMMGPGHTVPFTRSCAINNQPNNACTTNTFAWAAIDECSEFMPVKPTRAKFPLVGVLSDGAVFTTYQSTPSNKNRHRAAMVLKTFLGVDVLDFGPSLSPTSAPPSATSTPTMTLPGCQVCHRTLDGVASSFQNWDRFMQQGGLQGVYGVGTGVYSDQFTPRFNGMQMPTGTAEPLQWMAQQMAADPRFAYAAVTTWYTAITGQKPLNDPSPTDANFVSLLALKLYQNQYFTDQANQFIKNKYSVKSLIKSLIQSPWFMAADNNAGSSSTILALLDHTVRRSPEELNQAIISTTQRPWYAPGGASQSPSSSNIAAASTQYLLNDYRISYGGMDSLYTTMRNPDMSSVAAAVAGFMSQDVPCQTAAHDFDLPASSRVIFPYVDLTTTPDTAAGVAKIRQNIVYLHARFLGETLSASDPEVDATLAVFNAVYHNHTSSSQLAASCQTTNITQDATHTLHAWMGVMTYLLADFDFLYQ